MQKLKKKNLIIIQLLAILLASMLIFSACGKKGEEEIVKENFSFSGQLTAELNEEYDPLIEVNGETEIIEIGVKREGEDVSLSEGYKFTPSRIGKYTYTIKLKIDGKEYSVEKGIECKDTKAPISNKLIENKDIEVGLYTEFDADLNSFEVDDNNKLAKENIQKRIYSVTFNNKEYIQDKFDKYLFDKVGVYTIKVEFSDVSGNKSYNTYTITTSDTTKPYIDGYSVLYGWKNDKGLVKIPEINVYDISRYDLSIEVTKGEEGIKITDGYIQANVGDEISLCYTATDEYGNSSKFSSALKVLESGVLLDTAQDNSELFISDDAIISNSQKGINVSSNNSISTIKYKKGAYSVEDYYEYADIELYIANNKKRDIEITVNAVKGGEEIVLGEILVSGKDNLIHNYILDISSYKLGDIDGWSLRASSIGGVWYDLENIKLKGYKSADFNIINLKKEYKVGEALEYEAIEFLTDKVSDFTIEITKGNEVSRIYENDTYVFESEGEYGIKFKSVQENKEFVKTDKVVVSGKGEILQVGEFKVGRVGKEYTLPASSITGGKTLTTQVFYLGEEVTLNSNKFTPRKSGQYTAVYSEGGNKIREINFAVEDINAIDWEDIVINKDNNVLINRDERYITSGLRSLKVRLDSKKVEGCIFNKNIVLSRVANEVSMDIYANQKGKIKIRLLMSDKNLTSNVITLKKGFNRISYILGKSYEESFNSSVIKGIQIENESAYKNIIYIDNIKFDAHKTEEDIEVFNDQGEIVLEQNDILVVPQIIKCDKRYIQSIEVILNGENISQGMQIDLQRYPAGKYTIEYKVMDVFGQEHNKAVTIQILSDCLKYEIELDNYFVNTPFILAEPKLTSEKYSEEELAGAKVKKYYRVLGAKDWLNADSEISLSNTCTIEIMYKISVQGSQRIAKTKSYIHAQGVHLDFEKYNGGDHMVFFKGYDGPKASPSSAWAYDGEYSFHMDPDFIWGRTTTGINLYDENSKDPRRYELGLTADTVVFWAYSVADRTPIDLWIDNYDWKWVRGTELIRIKKGVHKYVVKLEKPITSLKRFTFEIDANQDFYIDNISFVRSADISYQDIEGKQFYSGEEIAITKPIVTNVNKLAYSQQDIDNIGYSFILNDGKEEKEYKLTSNEMKLDLNSGRYSITYIIKIGENEFTSTQNFIVRGLQVEFIELPVVLENNKTYNLAMVESVIQGITYKAYFKSDSQQKWQELVVNNGQVSFTLDVTGSGKIMYEASKGDKKETLINNILVRGKNTLSDFELQTDGTHYDEGLSHRCATISDEWSSDGKYSLFVKTGGWDFMAVNYFNYDNYHDHGMLDGYKQIDGSFNAVSMKINALVPQKNIRLEIFKTSELGGDPHWIVSQPMNIPKGEGTYLFEFDEYFSDIHAYGFEVCKIPGKEVYVTDFYIDSLYMYDIKIKQPSIPKTAMTQETISINSIIDYDIDLPCSEVVKYRMQGENEFKTARFSEGQHKIFLDKAGIMEIVVEVDIINKHTFNYTVSILDALTDPSVDDIDWK